jgi:hypothetical protein
MNVLKIDNDENGSTVMLNIQKSGNAFLTVCGSENANDYCLTPNEKGWSNAEKIVTAINAWLERTKTT